MSSSRHNVGVLIKGNLFVVYGGFGHEGLRNPCVAVVDEHEAGVLLKISCPGINACRLGIGGSPMNRLFVAPIGSFDII